MVIVTVEGPSGSVVRFASFLPYGTLVRDSVERRFEEACPCHAECAPAVAATLPPPAPAELTAADVRAIHAVAFDDADWETMRLCRVALGVDRFGSEATLTEATKRHARQELARRFPGFLEAQAEAEAALLAQAEADLPPTLRSRG